jgi:hypothetical protein
MINVVLLKGPGHNGIIHPIFDDIAESVVYWLNSSGISSKLVTNLLDDSVTSIIFGAGAGSGTFRDLKFLSSLLNPKRSVIFNMEQLLIGNAFVSEGYLKFLSNYVVLDYNINNIDYLRSFFPQARAIEFPLFPSKHFRSDFLGGEEETLQLVKDERGQREPTVTFYGSPSANRLELLNTLVSRGVDCRLIHGRYGVDLAKSLIEHDICLNMHYFKPGIFEVARCLRPLSLGMAVVSENSLLPNYPNWLESGVIFNGDDSLMNKVISIVNNPLHLFDASRRYLLWSESLELEPVIQDVMNYVTDHLCGL